MMKLQIKVKLGDRSAQIKIDNVTNEILEQLVSKTFQVIGGKLIEPKIKKGSEETTITLQDVGQTEVSLIDLLPEQLRDWYAEKKKEAEEKGVPTFWITGIKFKQGTPHYKAFYACPNCGLHSRHYVAEGTTEVECHNCKAPVDIFPAQDEPLKADKHGNFYVSALPDE
ncbi:hypothetical protein IC805_05075 [Geobacillus thermoleovorans]|uniref:hypothetical protein n=2 Tax=Geobacillus thermoleovorans group TaxID=1505648 RepID=UPI0005CCE5C3|nr:hypothetical protein [Geobacillus kaustophilus]OQP13170.1 hypothetical protein B1692_08940 [Geobacillus thermoleovorans]QNU22316.1 hypothetical protein IC805_05075 [Geobacillus thermoleovorans]